MSRTHLSKRSRLRDRLGTEPGARVYELVHGESKTFDEAAALLSRVLGVQVSGSMVRRWMLDWQQERASA